MMHINGILCIYSVKHYPDSVLKDIPRGHSILTMLTGNDLPVFGFDCQPRCMVRGTFVQIGHLFWCYDLPKVFIKRMSKKLVRIDQCGLFRCKIWWANKWQTWPPTKRQLLQNAVIYILVVFSHSFIFISLLFPLFQQ